MTRRAAAEVVGDAAVAAWFGLWRVLGVELYLENLDTPEGQAEAEAVAYIRELAWLANYNSDSPALKCVPSCEERAAEIYPQDKRLARVLETRCWDNSITRGLR